MKRMEVGLDETQGCEPVESVQGRILYMSEKTTSSAVLSGSGTLSIIVPVYNVEAYLDTCVRSLVEQEYPNIEVILIDDGSPDGCPAICDAWAARDARVRVIHSANHGVSHARNLGLAAARGAYIGFCDPDDWVEPEVYARMVEAMEAGADACGGGFVVDGPRGRVSAAPLGPARVMSQEEAIVLIYSSQRDQRLLTWSLWDKLFEKKLVTGLQFDESLALSEDQYFLWQIMQRVQRFAYVPLAGYHYCAREGSATHHFDISRGTYVDAMARIRTEAQACSPAIRAVMEQTYWHVVMNTLRGLLAHKADWGSQAAAARALLHAYSAGVRQHFTEIWRMGLTWRQKLVLCYLALPPALSTASAGLAKRSVMIWHKGVFVWQSLTQRPSTTGGAAVHLMFSPACSALSYPSITWRPISMHACSRSWGRRTGSSRLSSSMTARPMPAPPCAMPGRHGMAAYASSTRRTMA